ncbi:hypothetical protein WAI453_013016 [Rhynchosporium graminicola]
MPTKTGSIVEELRPDEAPLPKRVPLGYAPTDNAHVTSLAASSMASLQCRFLPLPAVRDTFATATFFFSRSEIASIAHIPSRIY